MDSNKSSSKRLIRCGTKPSDVVNPIRIKGRKPILCGSSCSSIKDAIIHRNKTKTEKKKHTACSTKFPSESSSPSLYAVPHRFICPKCLARFPNPEAVEAHHLTKHAVIELVGGDFTRKIVELICETSGMNSEKIDRILKVQNLQRTVADFESYREMVMVKSEIFSRENPRFLADGNEILMFYGSTIECYLGMDKASNVCTWDHCGVCQILRHGFSTKKESSNGIAGVFTSSTSETALERIEPESDGENRSLRKALLLCRVIAGRVHKPLESSKETVDPSCFDSLAGKLCPDSDIGQLYSFNPRALLPCFVIIFKVQNL